MLRSVKTSTVSPGSKKEASGVPTIILFSRLSSIPHCRLTRQDAHALRDTTTISTACGKTRVTSARCVIVSLTG